MLKVRKLDFGNHHQLRCQLLNLHQQQLKLLLLFARALVISIIAAISVLTTRHKNVTTIANHWVGVMSIDWMVTMMVQPVRVCHDSLA